MTAEDNASGDGGAEDEATADVQPAKERATDSGDRHGGASAACRGFAGVHHEPVSPAGGRARHGLAAERQRRTEPRLRQYAQGGQRDLFHGSLL